MTRTLKQFRTSEDNQNLAALGLHRIEDLPGFFERCNGETCVQACHIAGVFRVRECIPILVRILERTNTVAIAWEAAIALSLIGSRTCVRPLLRVARQHTLEEAKQAAIHALGVLGDYRAELILSWIAVNVAYPDGIRARAAEAMGSMRTKRVSKSLLKCLGDPSPQVRFAGLCAVGALRAIAALPEVTQLLNDLTIVTAGERISDRAALVKAAIEEATSQVSSK